MDRRIQIREAAALLGVSPRTVRRLCQRGELRAARVGKLWTTTVRLVHEYLSRQTSGPRNTDPPPPCPPPRATSFSATGSGMRASRSEAATSGEAYARLMSGRLASGSRRSGARPSANAPA
ncbi:helix-turn-helix domain-containing protein [Caldovatus aquaticus]|uniref:Helix-turn-helix domain-containing protein n=1 Tax=Caldovatus aquaticus TaxID=2865671 RepID=A0ABS7EY90_9PROT|nr:helix-turn-helix domain-containing protein [Caldovatus aquaticus]